MTFRAGLVTGIGTTSLAIVAGWMCGRVIFLEPAPVAAPKLEPPARVASVLKEEQINNITLTEDAVRRLGIKTSAVERKNIFRVRTYGGEIVVPAGLAIPVAAPMGGLLKAPPDGIPIPGSTVRKGQPILSLLPLLTPESRITTASALVDAEGQVKNAKAQVEAAHIAMDRAKRLFKEQAGSQRSVDECQALCQVAEKTLEAAEARRRLLAKVTGDIEKGTAAPMVLDSPEDGVLRSVAVLPGQNVPSGAPLFEVVDLSRVWVRVPIYGGDVLEIDATASAAVGDLGGRDAKPRDARPILAPPTANPLAGTSDLYYELDNRDGRLTPGQRIGATLTLKSKSPSLVVPWSAVIHDIQGGTWVYEQTAPSKFVRRRVQVQFVKDGVAVLSDGPPPNTQVASEGAQELFGTEVGFSK